MRFCEPLEIPTLFLFPFAEDAQDYDEVKKVLSQSGAKATLTRTHLLPSQDTVKARPLLP